MARIRRPRRPECEGLEGRQLLNGHVETRPSVVVPGRVFQYRTGSGSLVTASVVGKGFLTGTSRDADGALNLVYRGTNAASKIKIDVKGGTANLRTVRNASLSINNVTGVGGQILWALLGPKVNLVPGGKINLSSGIGRLELNEVGPNTEVHLRELPQTVQPVTNSVTATALQTDVNNFAGTKPLPAGTQAVAAPVPASNFAPTTYTFAGRTLTYSNDANGGSTLTGVTGQFVPTGNLIVSPALLPPAAPLPPPGVVVQVSRINAGNLGGQPIGTGQVFGYDAVANNLYRFDERTGAVLQTINPGGLASNVAGVGLGRNGTQGVVLLARGTSVQAFDVISGALVGGFSTAGLATLGGQAIAGIGSTATSTVLVSPTAQLAPGSADFGVAQAIDVQASLASGVAVASGLPFASTRGFDLAGGAAGLPNSNSLYLLGGAHFDSFQPALDQLGILTASFATSPPRELSRTALTNLGSQINVGLPGALRANPTQALGSVEGLLARVTGVANGQNVVSLLAPGTSTPVGTITLNDPNRLVALSGSVHPELAGAALFDVQGNIQAFQANDARGLALNDAGNLHMLKLISAADSTIVGQPVSHVLIVRRDNVSIISSARSVGNRGDVVIDTNLRPLGPLSLPA